MDITGDEPKVTENLVRNSDFWLPESSELFHSQAPRDPISLIANAQELVAQAGKAQDINRSAVALKVIGAAGHRLAAFGEFIGQGYARQTAREWLVFAIDITR